jgi:hypothetical protein
MEREHRSEQDTQQGQRARDHLLDQKWLDAGALDAGRQGTNAMSTLKMKVSLDERAALPVIAHGCLERMIQIGFHHHGETDHAEMAESLSRRTSEVSQ